MTLISQETLKELEEDFKRYSETDDDLKDLKQLIHDAKVARVAAKINNYALKFVHKSFCEMHIGNGCGGPVCTCGLSDILKELDELEKE